MVSGSVNVLTVVNHVFRLKHGSIWLQPASDQNLSIKNINNINSDIRFFVGQQKEAPTSKSEPPSW